MARVTERLRRDHFKVKYLNGPSTASWMKRSRTITKAMVRRILSVKGLVEEMDWSLTRHTEDKTRRRKSTLELYFLEPMKLKRRWKRRLRRREGDREFR
jgi:hypothetical protein